MYVIMRQDGMYVAPPGQEKSYTAFLQNAWAFVSKDEARRNCCDANEVVLDVREILNPR